MLIGKDVEIGHGLDDGVKIAMLYDINDAIPYGINREGHIVPRFRTGEFGNFNVIGRLSTARNSIGLDTDYVISYFTEDENERSAVLNHANSVKNEHGLYCDCCNSKRDRQTGFVLQAVKDSKVIQYKNGERRDYKVVNMDYDLEPEECLIREVVAGSTIQLGTSCVNITGYSGPNLDSVYAKRLFGKTVSDLSTDSIGKAMHSVKTYDAKFYMQCVVATMISELGNIPKGPSSDYDKTDMTAQQIVYRYTNRNRTSGNAEKGLDSTITKWARAMYEGVYLKGSKKYEDIAKIAGFNPEDEYVESIVDDILTFYSDKIDDIAVDKITSHNAGIANTYNMISKSACEGLSAIVSDYGINRLHDVSFALDESPKHCEFRERFNKVVKDNLETNVTFDPDRVRRESIDYIKQSGDFVTFDELISNITMRKDFDFNEEHSDIEVRNFYKELMKVGRRDYYVTKEMRVPLNYISRMDELFDISLDRDDLRKTCKVLTGKETCSHSCKYGVLTYTSKGREINCVGEVPQDIACLRSTDFATYLSDHKCVNQNDAPDSLSLTYRMQQSLFEGDEIVLDCFAYYDEDKGSVVRSDIKVAMYYDLSDEANPRASLITSLNPNYYNCVRDRNNYVLSYTDDFEHDDAKKLLDKCYDHMRDVDESKVWDIQPVMLSAALKDDDVKTVIDDNVEILFRSIRNRINGDFRRFENLDTVDFKNVIISSDHVRDNYKNPREAVIQYSNDGYDYIIFVPDKHSINVVPDSNYSQIGIYTTCRCLKYEVGKHNKPPIENTCGTIRDFIGTYPSRNDELIAFHNGYARDIKSFCNLNMSAAKECILNIEKRKIAESSDLAKMVGYDAEFRNICQDTFDGVLRERLVNRHFDTTTVFTQQDCIDTAEILNMSNLKSMFESMDSEIFDDVCSDMIRRVVESTYDLDEVKSVENRIWFERMKNEYVKASLSDPAEISVDDYDDV